MYELDFRKTLIWARTIPNPEFPSTQNLIDIYRKVLAILHWSLGRSVEACVEAGNGASAHGVEAGVDAWGGDGAAPGAGKVGAGQAVAAAVHRPALGGALDRQQDEDHPGQECEVHTHDVVL